MADSQLTPHLLHQSLIAYTVEATQNALSNSGNLSAEISRERARLALEFWISILDPAVDRERAQKETFDKYLTALDDEKIASQVAYSLPSESLSTASKVIEPASTDLSFTPAKSVLTLPDTLSEILSHISPLTQEGRNTLHAVASVSRSFHNVADRTLWHLPRDLDTVKQQVRFAFGASISGALSNSLGSQVKGLRIRRMSGGWNERVIVKIAQLCPNIESLLLHCGDAGEEDPITPSFLGTVHAVLSSLPNLKDLSLTKFSYTPALSTPLILADDAHIPFTKLTSLRVYDFGWYWPAISKDLGSSLRSLEIGSLPCLTSEQLITLAKHTPSLTSLSLSCHVEAEPLREFAASCRGLTRLTIRQYNDHGSNFGKQAVGIVAQHLSGLTELVLSGVSVGVAEVGMLTELKFPIEVVELQLEEGIEGEECNETLAKLVRSKKDTLRDIDVSFEISSVRLCPSEELISALGECGNLEVIAISFESPTAYRVPSAAVEKLLRGCPRLKLTCALEKLVEGNEVYEREFKERLEGEDEEEEVVLLGN